VAAHLFPGLLAVALAVVKPRRLPIMLAAQAGKTEHQLLMQRQALRLAPETPVLKVAVDS
jgi:hypothetical protein